MSDQEKKVKDEELDNVSGGVIPIDHMPPTNPVDRDPRTTPGPPPVTLPIEHGGSTPV